MKLLTICFSVALMNVAAHAQYTEYVVNGDFSATPFDSGWTNQSSEGTYAAVEGPALSSSGTASAFLASGDSLSFSQAFTQTESTFTYTMDLALATTSGNPYLFYLTRGAGSEGIRFRITLAGDIQVWDGATVGGSWITSIPTTSGSFSSAISFNTADGNTFAGDASTWSIYRLVLVGHDFGTESASYDLYLYTVDYETDAISLVAAAEGLTYSYGTSITDGSFSGISGLLYKENSEGNWAVSNISVSVPEPAQSSMMLGLGLLGLLWLRRRRQSLC